MFSAVQASVRWSWKDTMLQALTMDTGESKSKLSIVQFIDLWWISFSTSLLSVTSILIFLIEIPILFEWKVNETYIEIVFVTNDSPRLEIIKQLNAPVFPIYLSEHLSTDRRGLTVEQIGRPCFLWQFWYFSLSQSFPREFWVCSAELWGNGKWNIQSESFHRKKIISANLFFLFHLFQLP